MIHLDSTPSTNSAARQLLASSQLPHGTVVYTHCQTAGRGQRGNSWEAAPGLNVTMSLILRPVGVTAAKQFFISEAVALGVADVVETLLSDVPHAEVAVKWPNDIYVGDSKIAGILIENSLLGRDIDWSVAGIGLNVNQPQFTSDAPNPVSIAQLLPQGSSTLSIEPIISQIADSILCLLNTPQAQLHTLYKNRLWRRDGFHPYNAPELGTFQARILNIAPDGMLTLELPDNTAHTFAFKEVSAII